MKTKYYTFKGYCEQYQRLCAAAKVTPKKCDTFTDRGLLLQINSLLIRLNCVEMNEDELNRDLD
jgi:hypothetical protein